MDDSYHQDYSSLSRTMLSLFMKSPWEYYLTYVAKPQRLAPWQPTSPALKGSVLHGVLLENKSLDDLVLCYPDECFNQGGSLNGKRAALFRDDHPEQICFKSSEYADIAECVNAVLEHKDLRAVLDAATHKEQRFDAVLDGLPCRCKPDIAVDMGDHIVLYDLKFSLNVDPQSWHRMMKRMALWSQDAHYSRVMSTAFDKPVKFRFWNIEIKPPYRVQPYYLESGIRAEAHVTHRRLMEQLAQRYEAQEKEEPAAAWSDNWSPITVLNPWDLSEIEQNDEVQV